jgi:hypothetical protein
MMAGLYPYRKCHAYACRSLSHCKQGLHPTFQIWTYWSYSRYGWQQRWYKWTHHTTRSYNKYGCWRHKITIKNISRTLQDLKMGVQMWEQFTTKGIPKNAHKYVSYFLHYLLNQLPRSVPSVEDPYKFYLWNMDYIHVWGIGIHLDIFVTPHSGYRLCLLLF